MYLFTYICIWKAELQKEREKENGAQDLNQYLHVWHASIRSMGLTHCVMLTLYNFSMTDILITV